MPLTVVPLLLFWRLWPRIQEIHTSIDFPGYYAFLKDQVGDFIKERITVYTMEVPIIHFYLLRKV